MNIEIRTIKIDSRNLNIKRFKQLPRIGHFNFFRDHWRPTQAELKRLTDGAVGTVLYKVDGWERWLLWSEDHKGILCRYPLDEDMYDFVVGETEQVFL